MVGAHLRVRPLVGRPRQTPFARLPLQFLLRRIQSAPDANRSPLRTRAVQNCPLGALETREQVGCCGFSTSSEVYQSSTSSGFSTQSDKLRKVSYSLTVPP